MACRMPAWVSGCGAGGAEHRGGGVDRVRGVVRSQRLRRAGVDRVASEGGGLELHRALGAGVVSPPSAHRVRRIGRDRFRLCRCRRGLPTEGRDTSGRRRGTAPDKRAGWCRGPERSGRWPEPRSPDSLRAWRRPAAPERGGERRSGRRLRRAIWTPGCSSRQGPGGITGALCAPGAQPMQTAPLSSRKMPKIANDDFSSTGLEQSYGE